MNKLESAIKNCQQRVGKALEQILPQADIAPADLHQAMRYSVLDGGKRIRPVLVYLTGQALGADAQVLDIPASAIELIHVYSLVHDDLPAMDDDDLRRGKASCHKQFDEGIAILVGDALQSLAFDILAGNKAQTAEQKLKMINILARASGSRGMAGGQAMDIANNSDISLIELENMHIHKTGALIRAAVNLGTLSAVNVTENQRKKLDSYAQAIGLAFQIQDDILDVEGDTEALGKTAGADASQHKTTYPDLLGLQGAHNQAAEQVEHALAALAEFDSSFDLLRDLARYIISRKH